MNAREYKKTEDNWRVCVDPVVPEGWTLVHIGSPCHTTTPYDTYARLFAERVKVCLRRAQLPYQVHICHRQLRFPRGSGPGFTVRFGDDMCPPDIQVEAPVEKELVVQRAWNDWQHRRGLQKPVTIVGSMWCAHSGDIRRRDFSCQWMRGGSWPHVVSNAIAIAKQLGRDTTRLENYQQRKKYSCLT